MQTTSSLLARWNDLASVPPERQQLCPKTPAWLQLSGVRRGGHQRLCILDQLELRLELRERRCSWFWHAPGLQHPAPFSQQPDLLAPLRDPIVLALLGERLLKASPEYDRLDMPSLDTCRQAMTTVLRHDSQFAAWQKSWCRTLAACQPVVFALALRASLSADEGLPPSLYSRVWRHEESFRDVAANAPRLIPLLAITLSTGWRPPTAGGVLKALKERICALPSCGPATWRWLLKHGIHSLHPFVVALDDNSWSVVIAFLSLWTRAGLPPPLPKPVAAEWARVLTRAHQMESYCSHRIAIIAHYAAALDDSQARQQVPELAMALQLAAESWLPLVERNQKRAGWTWLRKEVRRYHLLRPLDEVIMSRLREQLPVSVSIDDFDMVILRSEADIAEEGKRMDHCMKASPDGFLHDGHLHFAVRCRKSGRSVGTSSFVAIGSRLNAIDVRGFNNDPAPSAAHRAACRLASHPKLLELLKRARV